MTAKEKIEEHKRRVYELMRKASSNIEHRGFVHDNSKLSPEEFPYFEEALPILDKAKYLSPEYKKGIEKLGKGLEHHYANNSHHPEFYKKTVCVKCSTEYLPEKHLDGCPICGGKQMEVLPDISQMSLFDLLEMILDWKAATEMTKDGNIMVSIEENQKRFKYSDELKSILRNTIKEILK